MAKIDINRGTTGVNLPAAVSSQIWSKTLESSAVMSATPQVALPGNGLTVPTITGEATADWVDETEEKPVSRPAVSSKSLRGYTMAVIVPFSNQFRRDAGTLYNELIRRLPYALGRKFDRTVFGLDTKPGSEFDQLSDAEDSLIDGTDGPSVLASLAEVYTDIAAGGNDISDWLANGQLFAKLFTATNSLGQQTFVPGGPSGDQLGSILGSPVTKIKAALPDGTVGFSGDFKGSAFWGQVEGVSVAISDQATIKDGSTQINLWQRNMFAVRAEMEVGFVVKDLTAFRELTFDTGDTGGGDTP